MSNLSTQPARVRLTEINIVRAIAILAVIMIHATSEGTYVPVAGSSTQRMFFSLNMFGSFAVPVFIFVSGLVLFYRYDAGWRARDTVEFYKKRIISVVYPYVLFSLFYDLFYQYLNTRTLSFSLVGFLKLLPLGDAGYHLYFMIIIMQFYVLFPLLLSAFKAWPLLARAMPAVAVLVQLVYHVATSGIVVPHSATLFITYFAIFVLGGYVGIHYPAASVWARRYWGVLLAGALIAGAAFVGLYWLVYYGKQPVAGGWFRLAYNAFALLAAVALIGCGKRLLESGGWPVKALLRLGQVSFGLYLVHPAVLSAIKAVVDTPGDIAAFRWYIAGYWVTTVAGTWLLVEVYLRLQRRWLNRRSRQGKRQRGEQ
ncbi:acyltransferase [Paenibacillus athensensis]|uniref:Acyltransferase 3 domain-containing protein n=1 Tax=Paenibacillus athensensis TaxID=1967502 RepID=A0A4Y8Q486_9BACL|nr:acyltransferase [Paenibacillus athensensis]MCD1261000.1 acyltransferase [Paenibacillus athensensis]